MVNLTEQKLAKFDYHQKECSLLKNQTSKKTPFTIKTKKVEKVKQTVVDSSSKYDFSIVSDESYIIVQFSIKKYFVAKIECFVSDQNIELLKKEKPSFK